MGLKVVDCELSDPLDPEFSMHIVHDLVGETSARTVISEVGGYFAPVGNLCC